MAVYTLVFTHRCRFCKQRLMESEVNDHRYYGHSGGVSEFDEIREEVQINSDDYEKFSVDDYVADNMPGNPARSTNRSD